MHKFTIKEGYRFRLKGKIYFAGDSVELSEADTLSRNFGLQAHKLKVVAADKPKPKPNSKSKTDK
jgi:hypothetical protein